MFSPRETERTNSPSASPTDDGARFEEARNDVIALSEARPMGCGPETSVYRSEQLHQYEF